MWIPKYLHTYLYRLRNISILNHSFFVKIHFGTEWNTNQSIFVSYFHFLTLSFLYYLVSYLITLIVLLSFYFFQKLHLFVMVIIPMYLGNGCWFYLFDTYMYFLYISLTNTIRKGLLSRGRIKGVLGQSVFGKAEIILLFF